jgi:hypothetical protein
VNKLSCEKFEKLIYLFWDGRLKSDEERELKQHLSECERCQKKLSLLELVEGGARRIPTKEPPQEYWDTFSSRVKDKILAHEEGSLAFRLKKAWENIFTFSPLKIKIAAGLVSILLVFIIGKLYIYYKGEKMVPTAPVVRTVEEQPHVVLPQAEKREGLPKEKGEKETKSASEKSQMRIKSEPTGQMEEKAIPKEGAVIEKEAPPKEAQPLPPTQIEEEKAIPPPAPLESPAPIEAEKPKEQPSPPPETISVGAGAEKGAEKRDVLRVTIPKEEAKKAEEVQQKGETQKQIMKDLSFSAKPPLASSLVRDYYVVNEKSIPKITDTDTLMQTDELRRIIQTWKTHLQEKPTDSLSQEGYLQAAIAYYLLAKVSQDTTIITEGSKLINEHLNQIKDQNLKNQLIERQEKINALRKR